MLTKTEQTSGISWQITTNHLSSSTCIFDKFVILNFRLCVASMGDDGEHADLRETSMSMISRKERHSIPQNEIDAVRYEMMNANS